MWRIAVVLSLLAAAASAEFPFSDQPLKDSINSNKVFFNVTDVKQIAGVWQAINTLYHVYFNEPYLYDGVSKFNMSCAQAEGSGWDYDRFITGPRATIIEVDEQRIEDGILGYHVESDERGIFRVGIVDYNFTEEIAIMEDGSCRKWRPYLDWELGKTMMIRNVRYYYYPDENGVTKYNELEGCVYGDVDHPQCFDATFEIDGGRHTGLYLDNPSWLECIAGPCLDLPFTLDGYVQTQGYVPAWVGAEQDDSVADDAGK